MKINLGLVNHILRMERVAFLPKTNILPFYCKIVYFLYDQRRISIFKKASHVSFRNIGYSVILNIKNITV